MWRSRARHFLLRSFTRRPSPFQSKQLSSKSLTSFAPAAPGWSRPINTQCPNLRLFCSVQEADIDKGDGVFGESPDLVESETSFGAIKDGGEGSLDLNGGKEETEARAETLSSLWEESIQDDDASGIFVAEKSAEEAAADEDVVPEIDMEHVLKFRSILLGTSQEPLESSLNQIEVSLSEDLVATVLKTPYVSDQNLVSFFRWALRREESVRSSRMVELLVNAIGGSAELSKMEAYALWDLVKDNGNEKGLLNTTILNQLIYTFGRLVKPRASLEVFNKFDEFGCEPDGNTYYLTIEALERRSMFRTALVVCEKMLSSENLPDGEKIGKIITFLCKGKMAKEAHMVYLMAQKKEMFPPTYSLNSLISSLSRQDETVLIALKLLENYPRDCHKYANTAFASVVYGLCRTKELQEAKKLLLRMVHSGPAPGSVVFNYVITAFSKGGEMNDAITFMKVMENRGLRPDIYTYTVIMSGYAKGGLMDEAYMIYCEAKKKHPKLSPVTYHILIRGYCKMEEYDKALNCLKDMKEDGVQPNSDEYNKLIQSLCLKALDWHTAEKLLEEMKESGLFLMGITRSLIAAVKELEDEVQSEEVSVEA